MTGRIIKATGGFYYVKPETADDGGVIECRARGIFRKRGMSPYVGDIVDISVSKEDGSGTVDSIHKRKNEMLRPPVANLDYMLMVLSTGSPQPNFLVTDKLLAVLEHKDIPVIIVITKPDSGVFAEIQEIYAGAGYPVFVVNNLTGDGADAVAEKIRGKLCAFSGNSGVGKSSLLNAIAPGLEIETGDTSRKLGRGRHTTRHCEIYELAGGTMIADTPGFSSVDIIAMSEISAEGLDRCFIDFEPFLGGCRFLDCRHMEESGCAVIDAVSVGKLSKSRYTSYRALYGEVKDIKDWERK